MNRSGERDDDGLVEIGVELHDSVHAFLVLRDFPLEHQAGSLQLRVELTVRERTRRYLGEDGDHVVVHHAHAVHQRQLHPVRFVHDPRHVPLVVDLLVGRKALQHLRVTRRKDSDVRDDCEDLRASLGGNERLLDLAHVHLHRNHFELVFVFVIVELVCSIRSIHSKKDELCVENA